MQRKEGLASFGAIAARAVDQMEREAQAKTAIERQLVETSRKQWAAMAAPKH